MLLQMMEAPIMTLVRFWDNHHLLDLVQRPVWRVVKDRSRSYVNAICAGKRPTCPAYQAFMWMSSGQWLSIWEYFLGVVSSRNWQGCIRFIDAVVSKHFEILRLIAVWPLTAELRDVRTDCAIASVESLGPEGPVCVRTAGGETEQFDKVVLATHSDVSLALLGSACREVSLWRGLDLTAITSYHGAVHAHADS